MLPARVPVKPTELIDNIGYRRSVVKGKPVRISAKADYAVRAMAELAASPPGQPVKAEALAASQDIPRNFLDNILSELRAAGLVRTLRGPEGGRCSVGRPSEITLAEVLRAVEGPLAAVRGVRPEELEYPGAATPSARGLGRGAGQPPRRARAA